MGSGSRKISEFDREEGWAGSPQQLEDEAHRLYKACEANLISTDEGPFLEILAKASPEHIAYLEQAYENHPKTKRSLRKTLEKGLSRNFRTALLAHCTPNGVIALVTCCDEGKFADTGTDERSFAEFGLV